MTHSELVNEYIKTFKKVYDITEEYWNDNFFRPLENAIKSSTIEFLKERLAQLKEWGMKQGRLKAV